MAIHMGNYISELLYQRKISKAEFANMLGIYDRTAYDIANRRHLHCSLMFKISKVLRSNLFVHYITADDLDSSPVVVERFKEQNEKITDLTKEVAQLKEVIRLMGR